MLDKLIKKVIDDAEKKAKDIIEKAEMELEERYLTESRVIEKEYEEKIWREKDEIDREVERSISAFVMEKEKEILALKNSFIDEVLKKTEERFNEFLRENMKEIIKSLIKDIKENDYVVRIPQDADVNIEGVKIEKDNNLKNGFVVVSSGWDIVFNWESIMTTLEETLRSKIVSLLPQINGEKETS